MAKQFIANMSKREKKILMYSVIFMLIAFLDRGVISPVSEAMNFVEKEISTTTYEIEKNLRIVSQRERLEKEEKRYSSFSAEAGSEEEETAALLKEIETLASLYSVYVNDMKPLNRLTGGGVKKFVVSVSCEADMEPLITFMYAIENADQLLQISAFSIVPKSQQSSVAQCELLIHKIVIL